jgi:hypothetical protein
VSIASAHACRAALPPIDSISGECLFHCCAFRFKSSQVELTKTVTTGGGIVEPYFKTKGNKTKRGGRL